MYFRLLGGWWAEGGRGTRKALFSPINDDIECNTCSRLHVSKKFNEVCLLLVKRHLVVKFGNTARRSRHLVATRSTVVNVRYKKRDARCVQRWHLMVVVEWEESLRLFFRVF